MTLVRWNPSRARSLCRDFDAMRSEFFSYPLRQYGDAGPNWSPRVDINENEKAFEIRAELPGIDKKEIEVTFKDDILAIKGERKDEVKEEDKKHNYFYSESRYGKFERLFRLNAPVVEEEISAKYKKGILTIIVPKADIPEPQKVEIQ